MAHTKKKRRRKHRGTQAGTVQRPVRSTARTKEQRRAAARERRVSRFTRPPSWRGAIIRGTLASVAFGALLVVLFDRPVQAALPLAAFMILLYVPLTYMTDRFMYDRRRRKMGAAPARPPARERPEGDEPAGGSGLLGRLRRRR
jgi:hypothetical protein